MYTEKTVSGHWRPCSRHFSYMFIPFIRRMFAGSSKIMPFRFLYRTPPSYLFFILISFQMWFQIYLQDALLLKLLLIYLFLSLLLRQSTRSSIFSFSLFFSLVLNGNFFIFFYYTKLSRVDNLPFIALQRTFKTTKTHYLNQ